MALNSSGRCDHCGAIVRNVAGRRLTIVELTRRHDEVCPGLNRK